MGRGTARLTAAMFALVLLCAPPAFAGPRKGVLEAGAAAVDASWHVGASAGQYASTCDNQSNLQANRCSFIGDHGVDPTTESTRRASSYGIQSRLSIRAIVIQGPAGN